jgi:CBS-domain-containing membrane protein
MSTLRLATLARQDLAIPGADPWSAKPGDPALTVMTDFRERSSVTVATTDTVTAALEHMKHAGVRCAFVTSGGARVVGLVTAYDLLGEKPTLHGRVSGVSANEVQVRDIMTPTADWQVVDVRLLEQATVADVHQLFHDSKLTHIAVMESADGTATRLRGLFSAAKIKRLLGS